MSARSIVRRGSNMYDFYRQHEALTAMAASLALPLAPRPAPDHDRPLSNQDRNRLLAWLKESHTDEPGLMRRGMTTAQALRYLAALEAAQERFARAASDPASGPVLAPPGPPPGAGPAAGSSPAEPDVGSGAAAPGCA